MQQAFTMTKATEMQLVCSKKSGCCCSGHCRAHIQISTITEFGVRSTGNAEQKLAKSVYLL